MKLGVGTDKILLILMPLSILLIEVRSIRLINTKNLYRPKCLLYISHHTFSQCAAEVPSLSQTHKTLADVAGLPWQVPSSIVTTLEGTDANGQVKTRLAPVASQLSHL